jgi:beta-galactosidase
MRRNPFVLLLTVIAFFAFDQKALKAAPVHAAPPTYQPPASPRATYNFNPGWKFVFGDQPGADQPGFNDSSWGNVSLPHTWNETDTYRAYISHGGGDQSEKMLGIGWYRKHFKLPASANGQKVFLQFDGMRQAGRFYLNGKEIGLHEDGVTAAGFDITNFANFGGKDNVLAVKVDNSTTYKEEATQTAFEWNAKDFNPNFGGLNRDAFLIVTGKVYQTLPLYNNLKTTGVYIYPDNIDIKKKTATIKVEAQVSNEEVGDYASITLSAVVVDADGVVRAKLDGNTTDLISGQMETMTAEGTLNDARFWDPKDPYLYHVYTILTVNGKVADVCDTKTGFRKAEFRGGVGTGGVYINDKFVWLTGWAQRSANDWAGLGGAYPDWMHDYTVSMMREANGNYLRWMHVSPQRADVEACDRMGIVEVCPAGDKERMVTGRQWDQRVEVMRSSMIFFRNNPSILFWEAGNTIVTPEQMTQMVALRKELDPHGGRVMGTRDNDLADANKALTPMSEYYGVMIGQAPQTDRIAPGDIFRGYSIDRRDKAPLIETEDFRDEAGRNVWDSYSPPHFGFTPKSGSGRDGRPVDSWHWNSESFCLAGATRYNSYVKNRIDNTDPAHSKWSGYASIYFSDSDADGRQQGSYVLRVSGKVDGVRIPKQMYYVSRVMQNEKPDLHIIGHWTYPAGTKKHVYVAATHCDKVELFLNGKSLGVQTKPVNFIDTFNRANPNVRPQVASDDNSTGYIYQFPDVVFKAGTLKAVATKGGKIVAQQELQTAGAPKAIKLTLHTNPKGLQADGSDVALVDFEVVDAQGRRCPTDEARVDFAITGPAVWRGGFNAAKLNTTNDLYLDTEAGINRVAIRSTLKPGTITLTASRPGLTSATLKIDSKAVTITNGLTLAMPPTLK